MKGLKLHLGCGNNKLKGFENLDKKFGDDITKLDLADKTVDLIYASHVLEYFDRDESLGVLKEWYRVLNIGGKIYLSVPDFSKISENYNNGSPLHESLGPLYGKMKSGEDTIYHKTIWDYSSLGEYLRIIGFRKIKEWSNKDISKLFKTNNDCSNAPISLNIVAEKNEYEGNLK